MINNLSRWLDYCSQKLKPLLPTYIKDSNQLLEELANLGVLPPNAKLATADANSMYTIIDTDHAILDIGLWLDSLQINNQLPPNFPLGAMQKPWNSLCAIISSSGVICTPSNFSV